VNSRLKLILGIPLILVALVLAVVYAVWGIYGVNSIFRNGISFWLPVGTDSPRLSPSMRLALSSAPAAVPAPLVWRQIDVGFEVADLAARVNGQDVDHFYLARIDPARYRFALRNQPSGNRDLAAWMTFLHPALVVNASYFAKGGRPDTPFLTDGAFLGPKDYDARAGAFVSSASFTGVRDLAHEDWKAAFQGADNAVVSYPLLVRNGASGVSRPSRWLANRSFVGEDRSGKIIIGTTTDAFFSLDRLAQFLIAAPLDLETALNLDGGPVACQGIAVDGYERSTVGRYELEVQGSKAQLLTMSYGTPAMPVVLAVFPK
jgi:hypothetical protein